MRRSLNDCICRARRLQAVGRELWRLGVEAASRASDVTQHVTSRRALRFRNWLVAGWVVRGALISRCVLEIGSSHCVLEIGWTRWVWLGRARSADFTLRFRNRLAPGWGSRFHVVF